MTGDSGQDMKSVVTVSFVQDAVLLVSNEITLDGSHCKGYKGKVESILHRLWKEEKTRGYVLKFLCINNKLVKCNYSTDGKK